MLRVPSIKMADYDDPHKNYSRLKETNTYLSLVLARRVVPPPAPWFTEHIEHIKVYLNVLEGTEDRDQRPAELMRVIINEWEHTQQFNLEWYLLICDKLLEIVGDIHLEGALEGMGV